MKYIKYFLLFIMIFPLNVFAEEICNNSEVKIKDLELVTTTGLASEKEDAVLRGNKIETDVEMYEVGDSITYQFTVDNKSNNDYAIDASDLVDPNSHIEYRLDSEDHSNKIKKKSTKDFTLTATYENEITAEEFSAGTYDASRSVVLQVKDPALINPMTGNFFYYMLILILIICVMFGIKSKNKVFSTLSILGLLLVPSGVYAYCQLNMEVDMNVEVQFVVPNPCTYNGTLEANAEYVNGQYTYTYNERFYNDYTGVYESGWSVRLTDKDSTAPVTSKLCTSINNKPIISMGSMFENSKTTSIDTSSFDTSNVINTWGMFYNASNITSLDVHNFDTSNDTNFGCMFEGMTSLESIDVSNFDVSKTTNLGYLFYQDSSLRTLDLSGWNTSRASTMYGICSGCTSLEELNLSGWDFSKYTSSTLIHGQLAGSTPNLKKIDMSNCKFKTLYETFAYLNLDELILDNIDTTQVTDMGGAFRESTIRSFDISSIDTSNATSMSNMFYRFNGYDTLDLSNFNTSSVTSMYSMFEKSSFKTLDLSRFDVSKVTSWTDMFKDCTSLESVNLDDWHLNTNPSSMFTEATSIKNVSMKRWRLTSNPTYLFSYLNFGNSIESVDVSNWNLSNATSLYCLFLNYKGTTIKGLNTWNASNITNMSQMFNSCSNLKVVDLSKFNLNNVSDVSSMFYGCNSLETVYGRSNADLTKLSGSTTLDHNVNFTLKS